MAEPQTLFSKIWDRTCRMTARASSISTARSFTRSPVPRCDGLRENNRQVRVPDAHLLVADHNVPTVGRADGIENEESRIQIELLKEREGIRPLHRLPRCPPGIVHVIAPSTSRD